MDEQQAALLVSFLTGYGVQWLRGFSWFNDSQSVFVWLVGGIVATFLTSTPPTGDPYQIAQVLLTRTLANAMTIAGGTAVGHVVSRNSPLAPRFNDLSKEAK